MDGNAIVTLIILIFLVTMSAFFSAAETSYTCLNKVRLKNKADSGDVRAQKVLALVEDYSRLISSILIGNNIVNILSASLATVLFVRLIGSNGVSVSTVVMTIVILLFGEVGPKTIARVMSERIAFTAYPLLYAFVKLLTPLNYAMSGWQKLIGKLVRGDTETGITEEELITMVEEAENVGEIDEHESELIRSAIEFNDLCVEDILTPRVNLAAIEIDDSDDQIASVFAEFGYSRLPVYDESVDNIVGILHEKDFYRNRGHLTVREMMSVPIYVMPTTHLSVLLKLLQKTKGHMAVVMDEYGGVTGIVTLEDILEELVGEIWDEHDEIVEQFRKLSDTSYCIDGSANLDDMLDIFKLKNGYESLTVSGWVLEELGRFPQQGDTFECGNLHVTVSEVDRHRVAQIQVDIIPEKMEA